MNYLLIICCIVFAAVTSTNAQSAPSSPTKPVVIRSKQQIADVMKEIKAAEGNKQVDAVPQAGDQMRVAIFHDEKRENDLHEVHDTSDDIYYVLEGEATLMLGGSLVEPNQISAGEWRSKTATGGREVKIKKGDLVVVPRGTPHQRTVTGKGFSMILIKVFRDVQPSK
jgi:mannose-6-phosphate isomerase-like protein (cupin superfamily)